MNGKLNEIMAEFISDLHAEHDAWGPDTKVYKLLDRYLSELYKKIELETITTLKVKGEQ